jgi:hypothetical protein
MRLFLAAFWVCFFVQPLAFAQQISPNEKKIVAFDAYLDDRLVGFHIFTIQQAENMTLVHSDLQLKAKILGLLPIKYVHQSTEHWQDSCLVRVDSTTQKRGQHLQVQAQTVSLGFKVIADDKVEIIKGCVKSFAYWDYSLLVGSQLLNTENGQLIDIKIETIINRDNGIKSIVINSSEAEIYLEYSADDEWLSLKSQLKVGGELHYIRQN